MGEALSLDTIVHSIDAELIAKGTSGKGPNRGAIVRHGRFTLWGFEGPPADMTAPGRRLFVNTVVYAAKHRASRVLEKRRNQTRDGLFVYLELARTKNAGFLQTMAQYLPEQARGKSIEETQAWVVENRSYLRANGRVFEVDTFAKNLGIPNHRRELLEHCIANLENGKNVRESVEELVRYTDCRELGDSADAWRKWYDENEDYLFFSDCDGSRFLVDEEAKTAGVATDVFRGWSSEQIDYRPQPVPEGSL